MKRSLLVGEPIGHGRPRRATRRDLLGLGRAGLRQPEDPLVVDLFRSDEILVLQLLERRVHRPRARPPHAATALGELGHHLVPVHRPVRQHEQHPGADVTAPRAPTPTAAGTAAEEHPVTERPRERPAERRRRPAGPRLLALSHIRPTPAPSPTATPPVPTPVPGHLIELVVHHSLLIPGPQRVGPHCVPSRYIAIHADVNRCRRSESIAQRDTGRRRGRCPPRRRSRRRRLGAQGASPSLRETAVGAGVDAPRGGGRAEGDGDPGASRPTERAQRAREQGRRRREAPDERGHRPRRRNADPA